MGVVKPYTTPVIVEPVANGFVFALTYGRDVDWYRNVLAAGQCGLRWHGKDYQLATPERLAPPRPYLPSRCSSGRSCV